MKTIKFSIIRRILAASLILASIAPNSSFAADSKLTDARIEYSLQPVYPVKLSSVGINEGSATIMVSLDNQGKLIDWMPLSTTRPEFVKAIAYVISSWTFAPATLDGKAIPSAMSISFSFSSGNVVMNINGVQMVQSLMNGYNDPKEKPLVARFSDLDGLPEPITITQPRLGSDVPKGSRSGEVELGFFIDDEGKVRMPVLMECNGDIRMAYAAYDALVQWQFSKPTVKGKAIAVRASQKFIFTESDESDSAKK